MTEKWGLFSHDRIPQAKFGASSPWPVGDIHSRGKSARFRRENCKERKKDTNLQVIKCCKQLKPKNIDWSVPSPKLASISWNLSARSESFLGNFTSSTLLEPWQEPLLKNAKKKPCLQPWTWNVSMCSCCSTKIDPIHGQYTAQATCLDWRLFEPSFSHFLSVPVSSCWSFSETPTISALKHQSFQFIGLAAGSNTTVWLYRSYQVALQVAFDHNDHRWTHDHDRSTATFRRHISFSASLFSKACGSHGKSCRATACSSRCNTCSCLGELLPLD